MSPIGSRPHDDHGPVHQDEHDGPGWTGPAPCPAPCCRGACWVNTLEFIDLGHSGAKARRPALDRLRQAARSGEVRQVLVFALDRLGRSLRDLLLLLDDLSASGCSVISLRESIDLSTPTGRLLVHLIASLAEFERELIRDRVRAGLARVKATGRTHSGKAVGRPRRDVDLAAVNRLRSEGRTWRQIAQALKIPRRTLGRAFNAK
jgi:DNA invertase Pin-like site-specific DNA recombinase